jgi:DNA polymerase-4
LEAQSVALKLWEGRNFARPLKVSVNFTGLKRAEAVTPSLFAPEAVDAKVGRAVDAVNQKFGKNQVYLASLSQTKDHASEKIAFQKTWLFAEGKGDHEWVDTRRAKTDPDPST